jgi:chorismate mutase
MSDEQLEGFRDRITEIDRLIVDAVNRRLGVVAELKRYKDANGISFVDPHRESSMIEERLRENGGPLSDEGLRELYLEVLALTKRELGRGR